MIMMGLWWYVEIESTLIDSETTTFHAMNVHVSFKTKTRFKLQQ